MAIKTKCTHCGETFNVDEKYIGTTKKCPKCKKEFELKKVEETTVPPARKPVVPAAPKPRPSTDDSRTVHMPAPTEAMLLFKCSNCEAALTLKKRMAGKQVKCSDCNVTVTVDVTGYTDCPTCKWTQKAKAVPGKKMTCGNPACGKPFTVEAPADEEEGDTSLKFDAAPKKKDEPKDDKDDGKWIWYRNPGQYKAGQWWVVGIVALLLLSLIGSWWGGGSSGKNDPAANQKAIEAAKKAKAESEARTKKALDDAAKAEAARQALIQKQIDDAEAARKAAEAALLKKKQDDEAAAKAKAEKFQPAETWVKGNFKVTYQKGSKGFPDGRFGTWSITESTRKGDMVEFKGTFDHSAFNKDNKGPVTGTVSIKSGELKATLIVSDVKGKLLEFTVEMKVPVREDGKIDVESEGTGNLKYVWIREIDGKAFGPVPVGQQTPHDYRMTRVVDKK